MTGFRFVVAASCACAALAAPGEISGVLPGAPGVEPRGAAPVEAVGPASADTVFEAAVRRDLASTAATGAVFAVVDTEGIRSIEAVGYLDLERTAPMSPGYLFHLGGWGNVLLASAALALHEEGVLALDAPIGQGVPGLPREMGRISLEQLLVETGGLDDAPLQTRRVGEPVQRIPPEQELGLLTDRVILAAPGAIRSPSRHHWLLAGHVVETAAGIPLEGVVSRVFGEPLGLHRTVFAPPGASPAGSLSGFQGSRSPEAPYVPAPFPDPAVLQPQERIWSTAEDIGRIVAHWLAEPTHLVELARPRVRDPADPDGGVAHALGFRIEADGSWSAAGESPGHSVLLRLFPADGVAVLLMTNGGGSTLPRSRAMVEAEARAVRPEPPPELRELQRGEAPPLPLERLVEPLPAHAGLFRNGSEVFRLVVHEGRLAADPGLPEPLPIRVGEGGQLEAHLEDGRTAMVIHLFRDSEGRLLALYRGVAFRHEDEP
ncbi:MAG: class A beta-lactamase-related serine hydrolase [Gemmatimonadales bacterium]|nr:MAG: class A beta-lactamase-related serine hydrolase [Gemmatimonadales bacterium]